MSRAASPLARAGPSGIVTPPTSSSAPASEAATDPQAGGPVDITTDVVAADLEATWAVAGEGGLMGLAVLARLRRRRTAVGVPHHAAGQPHRALPTR